MRRFLPHPVTALLVLVLAGVGALSWWLTTGRDAFPHRDSTSEARVQQAVDAARQAAINSTSYDYRSLDKQFAVVAGELSGDALSSFTGAKTQIQQQFTSQKLISTASVLDSAILPGATSSGDVSVMIALDITYQANGGQAQLTSQLVQVEVVNTGKGWTASKIDPYAVSVS